LANAKPALAPGTKTPENVLQKVRREKGIEFRFLGYYCSRGGCSSSNMAVITVSGEPGCRTSEVARLAAQRLGYEHISAARLDAMVEEEFGPVDHLPAKLWPSLAASILLRHATEAHLVIGVDGAELLFRSFPALLRIWVVAPDNRRIGNIMLDDHADRPTARVQMRQRERALRSTRKARFGRALPSPHSIDLSLNAETLDSAHMAALIEAAVDARNLNAHGFLSKAAEAQLQFALRLQLSKHGVHPISQASLKRTQFSHSSEQIFASLLDFYRIAWEYEPRTFPLQDDGHGNITESFTPDFYLPESNTYIELTTMKQSLVTKKNRKIRRLRELYPDVQIQVFYQKDMQDLVLKYGLALQLAPVA
jgi:cytidylate kinase